MKQTPIPEKIKPQYDKLGFPTGTWMYINSLIDVLTEQQREIGDQEGQIEHLERRVYELLKRVTAIEDSKNKPDSSNEAMSQPYTAMRSTGECVRCGHDHEQDDYPACSCCNTLAPKYIKPQEDIRERLIEMVKDEQRITAISGTPLTPGELADKILAIVKGE